MTQPQGSHLLGAGQAARTVENWSLPPVPESPQALPGGWEAAQREGKNKEDSTYWVATEDQALSQEPPMSHPSQSLQCPYESDILRAHSTGEETEARALKPVAPDLTAGDGGT